ncbi:hypothetical protein LC092_13870 [Stappia stellulata]|uniref:capsular polysaccharide export protein, LipB/KpsS family n=1 Tax=Stappia stellulata TaxID=71235 RepID=UPI001CD2B3F4|nr:hypothetical protein [Stappia stellulata]MCA1243535.1 hypothetical protein [Stappia stellulata]
MRVRVLPYLGKLLRKSTQLGGRTLDRITQKPTPRSILSGLNDSALAFFDRKIPTGDKYPYEVHYAPALRNAPTGVEAFHLVGRAWRKTPDAPIAIAFGFNAWKYGFMADYCPDVRIAFAPRKFLGWDAWRAARTMQPAPSRIYVWGYTDPGWLARFARKKGIPLIRVEDGFLRSAELGASHATPYSLVFDSKGLYYNASEPNDLADILASYDFAGDAALMQNARSALNLLIEKRLSKYNMPDVGDPARHFSIKTRRRVLVLGQVDNDAAVRMGNPAGWRMSDIVRLAKLENPDAEILYRPHPDIYHGYQRSRFKAERIEKFARILSPDGPLIDLLETVDHVYTLSSLSGLEALLRGVEVTTLGTPFYAGWGLTDDRTQEHRGRDLTVLELFAGVYLKYPRYLADTESSFDGLTIAALRILGERQLLSTTLEPEDRLAERGSRANNPALFSVPASLALLAQSNNSAPDSATERHFRTLPLNKIATFSDGAHYQRCAASIIIGYARSNSNLEDTINRLTSTLEEGAVLHALSILHPTATSSEKIVIETTISDALIKLGNYSDSASTLKQIKKQTRREQENSLEPRLDETKADNIESPLFEILFHELSQHMLVGNYSAAERIAMTLILSNYKTIEVIEKYYQISFGNFDIASAHAIAQVSIACGTSAGATRALAMICQTIPFNNLDAFTVWQSANIVKSPSKVSNLLVPQKQYESEQEVGAISKILIRTIDVDGRNSIQKVQAQISLGRSDAALETAENMLRQSNPSPQMTVAYSQALASTMRYKDALENVERALSVWPSSLVYREALRLCILLGDYKKGEIIYRAATKKRIELGDMIPRKILFGIGEVEDAFRTFRDLHIRETIAHHFHDQYYKGKLDEVKDGSVFLTAIFGPGDEIRFASIYADMRKALKGDVQLRIGCDPRLLDLLSRSFKGIDFVPVKRLRGTDAFKIEDFDKVRHPGNRLALDNNSVNYIMSCDKFALATDFLHEFRKNKEDFSRGPYLVSDKTSQRVISESLPKLTPLVGVSWRSSLNTSSRNEHYLSIDELAPLFEIDGIQFVNLQYDDCEDEIAWVENKFPGKLVDLKFIDQYNDLDSVASLMSCLDLVISPATTVVELAGALGRPTWLLSNSSELHWRKRSGQIDVWHSSVSHIEGNQLGDKESLVTNLVAALIEWRDARHAQA